MRPRINGRKGAIEADRWAKDGQGHGTAVVYTVDLRGPVSCEPTTDMQVLRRSVECAAYVLLTPHSRNRTAREY